MVGESAERSALIDLLVAVGATHGTPVSARKIAKLDNEGLSALVKQSIRRLDAGPVDAKKIVGPGGEYDEMDAKLGRILLDGVNRDIGVMDAARSLKNFAANDYPRARARSRARRLNVNMSAAGPDTLATLLSDNDLPVVPEVIARIKEVRKTDPDAAATLAKSVADRKMTSAQSLFIAFALHAAGEVLRPARLLQNVDETRLNVGQSQRYDRILSEAEFLSRGPDAVVAEISEEVLNYIRPRALEARAADAGRPGSNVFRMAYVAASTLPYNKVGYTTRTHRVVKAIDAAARQSGGELVVVARPGFPFDRFDLDASGLRGGRHSDIDGIRYHYLENPVPMQDSLVSFAKGGAAALAGFFIDNRITAVTAASNHVNAMSAMIAARVLGLPFTYEVRGLWEETRASKRPGWDRTDRYRVERMLEAFVIKQADSTFFITRQVRELFFDPATTPPDTRAYLAPNCAVLGDDRPQVSPYSGKPTNPLELFYVGSLVEYEGLQLVFDALANMADRDNFRLTIVGGGNFSDSLRDQVQRLGLDGIVEFKGRVDPSEVAQFFDRADVVLVPRLPHRVCNLVSPLKPLEAMSYGRVCLVSDVAPMADLVTEGKTGFLFEAGSQQSLEAALRRVYESSGKFPEIAEQALDYLMRHRDWRDIGQRIYTVNLESVYPDSLELLEAPS